MNKRKYTRKIIPGSIFSGLWFTGMVEVISVNENENELEVLLSSPPMWKACRQWKETWDLEITQLGFGLSGDYFWKTDFPGYPEFRFGNRDNELVADYVKWSGGIKPEDSEKSTINIYCSIALPKYLSYSSKTAFAELTKTP